MLCTDRAQIFRRCAALSTFILTSTSPGAKVWPLSFFFFFLRCDYIFCEGPHIDSFHSGAERKGICVEIGLLFISFFFIPVEIEVQLDNFGHRKSGVQHKRTIQRGGKKTTAGDAYGTGEKTWHVVFV